MSTPLKQRALATVGNVARHVPHDAAQMFSFVASPKVRTDPWALYQRLHRRGPVRKGPYGIWLVASHAGITDILREAPTTVDESQADELHRASTVTTSSAKLIDKTLLFTDPPDHSRLRRLVSRSFTPAHGRSAARAGRRAGGQAARRAAARGSGRPHRRLRAARSRWP